MSNEQIKEELSVLKETYKWSLNALILSFAGMISMVLRVEDRANSSFDNFLGIGGGILVIIFFLLIIKLKKDINSLIKDMK